MESEPRKKDGNVSVPVTNVIQSQTYGNEPNIFHFRCLQLLNKEFNSYFGPVILPSCFTFQLPMIPIANFMTIKMYDKLSAPILAFVIAYSIGINTGVMLTIAVTAKVYERSLGFRRYLSNTDTNFNLTYFSVRLFKKRRKWNTVLVHSCCPLRIAVGYHTFFKKATAVATFALIVYSTMRLVVIFKKP